MKLKGFTLAEVLITITLIGVVATLTLPALVADVQRQQAGPALVRALATLDTANALVINEHELYSFRRGCGDDYPACFARWIAEKMGAASTTAPENGYGDFDGGAITDTLGAAYLSKNGFIYYMPGAASSSGSSASSESSSGSSSGEVSTDFISVHIDINGEKGPNMLGKDFYEAVIDLNTGTVYGKGSRLDNSTTERWLDKCTSSTAEGFDAHFCSGAIVDNGGRVIYKW